MVLNTLYDEHIHLQKEIGVAKLDPLRPILIEILDHLSREKSTDKAKVSYQLERFSLRIDQLEEINSRIAKLEVKLNYLKEKQYLSDFEKKLVGIENLANNIYQQAAELKKIYEILKKLLETLVFRIGGIKQ